MNGTGICSELQRYNSVSISYIFYMGSASLRKTLGLIKCLRLFITNFLKTEDLEYSNQEHLHGQDRASWSS